MNAPALRFSVDAIGVLGPGLADWAGTRAMLRAEQPYLPAATVVPAPQQLPPAERRRVGASVRVALAIATQAFAAAGVRASDTATVFSSSGADGDNCHALCEALAAADPLVSPTRFTNSVHNAPAGYWGIAERAMAPSTSLCAFDASFGAGLLDAATTVAADGVAVALVAYDVPYPQPLHAVRPLPAPFGIALVLRPAGEAPGLATVELLGIEPGSGAPLDDPALEQLRGSIPAARGLPLLAAIARGGRSTSTIDYLPGQRLVLQVETP